MKYLFTVLKAYKNWNIFPIRKFTYKLFDKELIFGIDEPHESDYGAYVEGYIDKNKKFHVTKTHFTYERSGSAKGSIEQVMKEKQNRDIAKEYLLRGH